MATAGVIPGFGWRRFLLALALLTALAAVIGGGARAADQLYLSTYDETVNVVNASAGDGAGTIAGFEASNVMALTPDRKRLFVADWRVIRVINTTNNAVITDLPYMSACSYVQDMVVSNDSRLYVSDSMRSKVAVFDTQTYAPVRNISTYVYGRNGNPADLALSPDGRRLYVAHCISGDGGNLSADQYNVTIFDTATGAVITSKRFDTMIRAMALSPDGSLLYVATRNFSGAGNYKVTRMAASDLSRPNVRSVSDSYPMDMLVGPDGKVYVCEDRRGTSGAITVLNKETTAVLQTLTVRPRPEDLSLSPDGKRLYVAASDGVSVVTLATGAAGGFDTGGRVYDVAAVSKLSLLYVVPLNLTVSPTPAPAAGGSVTPVPLPTDPPTPAPTAAPAASPAPGPTDSPGSGSIASPAATSSPGPDATGSPSAAPSAIPAPAGGFSSGSALLAVVATQLGALIAVATMRQK